MELLPFRYALEIFIIFLPILYHAIYGLYIAFTAKNNAVSYGYFRNWMFVFQRISGIVTLIFISWHVWETRIQAMLGKEVNYDMMADIFKQSSYVCILLSWCCFNNFPLCKWTMDILHQLGNYSISTFTKNLYLCNISYFLRFILCRCECIISVHRSTASKPVRSGRA